MNKHYIRGRNAEYSCIKELESEGYLCIRSAGSKKIDIVAFLLNVTEKPLIRSIMITVNNSKTKRLGDVAYLKSIMLPSIVSKEFWLRKEGSWVKIIV